MRAGTHGVIDCVAVDRDGALVIVAVADDPDAALGRLLDQYLWGSAERDLLARAFPRAGAASQRPIRCLLVAPSFHTAFLHRLGLLTVMVEPFVARPIPATDPAAYLVEPAAAIYGTSAGAVTVPLVEPTAESWPFALDRGPDSPLRPIGDDDPVLRDLGLHDGGITVQDLDRAAAYTPPSLPEGPMPVTESLTAEEMEEFERFDRGRRVRDGAP